MKAAIAFCFKSYIVLRKSGRFLIQLFLLPFFRFYF
jgi:hypothetical protein